MLALAVAGWFFVALSLSLSGALEQATRDSIRSITGKGRRLWEDEMVRALSDARGSAGDLLLGLSGLPLRDRGAAVAALRQRIADLESGLSDLDRGLEAARPLPSHVEAMFDLTRTRLTAEREWLRSFVVQLRVPSKEEVRS